MQTFVEVSEDDPGIMATMVSEEVAKFVNPCKERFVEHGSVETSSTSLFKLFFQTLFMESLQVSPSSLISYPRTEININAKMCYRC